MHCIYQLFLVLDRFLYHIKQFHIITLLLSQVHWPIMSSFDSGARQLYLIFRHLLTRHVHLYLILF